MRTHSLEVQGLAALSHRPLHHARAVASGTWIPSWFTTKERVFAFAGLAALTGLVVWKVTD